MSLCPCGGLPISLTGPQESAGRNPRSRNGWSVSSTAVASVCRNAWPPTPRPRILVCPGRASPSRSAATRRSTATLSVERRPRCSSAELEGVVCARRSGSSLLCPVRTLLWTRPPLQIFSRPQHAWPEPQYQSDDAGSQCVVVPHWGRFHPLHWPHAFTFGPFPTSTLLTPCISRELVRGMLVHELAICPRKR